MSNTVTPDDFWPRLDDVRAGMLNVNGGRPVPMSHYPDRETNRIWFITAEGTDLVEALRAGPQDARYIIASGDGKLDARADGKASLSGNRDKLDEIWNAIAAAWFEGGRDDEDIALVCLDLSEAEIWATDGGLKFLYETAKANVTGQKPDIGDQGVLRF